MLGMDVQVSVKIPCLHYSHVATSANQILPCTLSEVITMSWFIYNI